MKPRLSPIGRLNAPAFTLVELMVAMTVLSLVILVTFNVVKQTSNIWVSSNAKLTSFEAAATGFDLMTRTVSQATLNTYWGYYSDKGVYKVMRATRTTQEPIVAYGRASELRFMLASGTVLLPNTALTPIGADSTPALGSQAIFFQAPLGYTMSHENSAVADFSPLVKMLNTVGFFIAYTPQQDLPQFLMDYLRVQPAKRYRLYQMLEPGEKMRVYNQQDLRTPTSYRPYETQDWFTANLGTCARKIADNVIGLIIRARYPNPGDPGNETKDENFYTESYLYDSWDPTGYYPIGGTPKVTSLKPHKVPTYNQLPTAICVTMIVIDENSARRLGTSYETACQPPAGTFVDPTKFEEDLKKWKEELSKNPRITFQVYNANVAIRGAKWSSD